MITAISVCHQTKTLSIFLHCQDELAITEWTKAFSTFCNSITKLDTESNLLAVLIYDLHCWRRHIPLISISLLDSSLQHIFVYTWNITYDKLLEGLLPKSIIHFQENHYWGKPKCQRTGQLWGKKLSKWLWSLTHAIWEIWNHQLHETDRINDLQGLSQVKQSIQSEFNLRLQFVPSSKFSIYFSTNINIVIQHPIDNLCQWLLNIRLGCSIHGSINTISDVFSVNSLFRCYNIEKHT